MTHSPRLFRLSAAIPLAAFAVQVPPATPLAALPPSPATVWIQTRAACLEGRVVRGDATAVTLAIVAPSRGTARIEAMDILAVLRAERRGRVWPRVATSVALGAGAAAAAAHDRRGLAAAVGLSAWLVPWWGWQESRSARLVHVSAEARRPARPAASSSRCERMMYDALRGR